MGVLNLAIVIPQVWLLYFDLAMNVHVCVQKRNEHETHYWFEAIFRRQIQ